MLLKDLKYVILIISGRVFEIVFSHRPFIIGTFFGVCFHLSSFIKMGFSVFPIWGLSSEKTAVWWCDRSLFLYKKKINNLCKGVA